MYIYISEVGGVCPTGKSKISCAAGACGRQCCFSRWGWRRQDVLLLLLLREFRPRDSGEF